jgi:predicted DNA-binding protein
MKVVNLRLPDSLNNELNKASEESGLPKNRIFNQAVTAALENYNGNYGKPEYVHTCVRLPGELYDTVRSIANKNCTSMNVSFIHILANHLGVDTCVVEEVHVE